MCEIPSESERHDPLRKPVETRRAIKAVRRLMRAAASVARPACAAAFLFAVLLATLLARPATAGPPASAARIVPQIDVTELYAAKLAFAPSDAQLLLAVSFDGHIDIFDLSRPGPPVKITEIRTDATDAVFTPRAASRDKIKVMSGGKDGTLRLWALDGKAAAPPIDTHEGKIESLAFSPDGTLIAAGSLEGILGVWRLDGRAAVAPFDAHAGSVNSVAFSPRGDYFVSGGADAAVRLWRLDGRAAAVFGHSDSVSSVAFSPDGTRIASGSDDRTLRLWRPDGGEARIPLTYECATRGGAEAIQSVAFSPDGTHILAGSSKGRLCLWKVDGKKAVSLFGLWMFDDVEDPAAFGPSYPNSLSSMAFSSDGTRIASAHEAYDEVGQAEGRLILWTHPDGKAASPFQPQELRGNQDLSLNFTLSDVSISPDGMLIAVSDKKRGTRLWKLAGKPVVLEQKGVITSVAFSADGQHLVSGDGYGKLRLWTPDGRATASFDAHGARVTGVAVSPDGSRIVSGSVNGTLRLWTRDGQMLAELCNCGHGGVPGGVGPDSAPESSFRVAFSPDGQQIVSGNDTGMLQLWSRDGRPESEVFGEGYTTITGVAYSPGGARIISVAAGQSQLRMWTRDGKPAGVIPVRCAHVSSLSGGRFIWAVCSDRIEILGPSLEFRGELFLHKGNTVAAWVFGEGVYFQDDTLKDAFRAVRPDGSVVEGPLGVPRLPLQVVRQRLFGP